METKQLIIQKAKERFSLEGYGGLSMRKLAEDCDISLSVLYYYFQSKDLLLEYIFNSTNTELGVLRKNLKAKSPLQQLKERIEFQFQHAADVVFVLKYYMYYRRNFKKNPTGYIPAKGSLHIEEVLTLGMQQNVFNIKNVQKDAKVIAHAINGFILEYYPDIPTGKELQELVDSIYQFVVRAVT